MSRGKTVGILIIVVVGIFGGLYIFGTFSQQRQHQSASSSSSLTPSVLVSKVSNYMAQQNWNDQDANMTRVAEGIVNSQYFLDKAYVVIVTLKTDCWSGNIMGSDVTQTTVQGCNTSYMTIPCGGIYSISMQRQDQADGSNLLVQVWHSGQVMKQASTSASYGLVSFAGTCA
ncbi:MAG: hypothetical protein M3239_08060 [Thermoproteota archaeon]|jgi:hypothetical protein|nr:hypothetical protein [Thermoproteota archaeon]